MSCMEVVKMKIKKSSKAISIALKVIYITMIVGIFVPISTLVLAYTKPEVCLTSINKLSFYSSSGRILESSGEVIAEMSSIIVSTVLIFFMIIEAYKLFNSIYKNLLPFSKANVKKLKNIGVLLLVYSFVMPIAKTGFYSSFAPQVSTRFSIDFPFLVLAFIFFFIGKVFEYGAELQRQWDETL